MKVLLDVKDNKSDFVMELLRNLSFVKVTPLSVSKAKFLEELKGSVKEVALAKQGKIKLQSASDFLNEL
jgi:hypothetical protein